MIKHFDVDGGFSMCHHNAMLGAAANAEITKLLGGGGFYIKARCSQGGSDDGDEKASKRRT